MFYGSLSLGEETEIRKRETMITQLPQVVQLEMNGVS
jgi:hypothetical protein